MSKLLYLDDSYVKSSISNIINLEEANSLFIVELDETPFYPEGGGQPSDIGYIDDAEVVDVQKKDGRILHYTKTKPTNEKSITCTVNFERRLEFSKQHGGQHILSANLMKHFDAMTVGFHIGDDYITVDTDKKLSRAQIDFLEIECNKSIQSDLIIQNHYPTDDELLNMDLRKMPKVSKDVRIVQIGDLDATPCGGTHTKSTIEIGLLKIKSFDNYKKGVRIEFVCGNWAINDYIKKNHICNDLVATMSTPLADCIGSIEKLKTDIKEMKRELAAASSALLEFEAQSHIESSTKIGEILVVKQVFEDGDFNAFRKLAEMVTSSEKNVFAIYALKKEESLQIIISRSKELDNINVKEVFKEVMVILDGRGGGSTQSAQGSGKNVDKLDEAIEVAIASLG
jgi:alanyl-tRNA synthetase